MLLKEFNDVVRHEQPGRLVKVLRLATVVLQLTDTNGNDINICASAITGGSSYGSAVVLGSNFLRAWYTVYSLTGGTPQVVSPTECCEYTSS